MSASLEDRRYRAAGSSQSIPWLLLFPLVRVVGRVLRSRTRGRSIEVAPSVSGQHSLSEMHGKGGPVVASYKESDYSGEHLERHGNGV